MKERPIIFNGAMVRAILEGRKSQTRRVVKFGKHPSGSTNNQPPMNACPYGQPGDRLWVRETWQGPMIPEDCMEEFHEHGREQFQSPGFCAYRASGDSAEFFDLAEDETVCRWRPSIHMPRWASRITLEVTAVRVERLQEISEADARAEGSDCLISDNTTEADRSLLDLPLYENGSPYRNGFALLWESINGDGSWDANPWVWVVDFTRTQP